MLRRVIALLFSFAVLAERSAGRSSLVRWFLLWILRRAETAAEAFVFDETGLPPLVLEGFAPVGNGPDDALCLAARFRALAAALRALLPIGHGPGRRRRRGFAFGPAAPGSAHLPGGWTREPYDTS